MVEKSRYSVRQRQLKNTLLIMILIIQQLTKADLSLILIMLTAAELLNTVLELHQQ